MKLSELKNVVKSAVREAIQEELKDILLEAVKTPKAVVHENVVATPTQPPKLDKKSKEEIRENYMNVLGGMMPGADGTIKATTSNVPLKVGGNIDTTSANGSLPEGNVSMDQIMGLMNSKG
jgi:hypothetical protein|tara:strand:+ start:1184 stop:1546 length:363 start_codon:yes stop_codon:yes gene_type:complete